MTITDTICSTPTGTVAPSGALVGVAALSFAVATAGTLWGAHERSEIAICMGELILAAALIYGVLLPRKLARPSAHAALAVSITGAVLIVPAFWSGLPMVLGVAGVMLGKYALLAGKKRTTSIAAIVVGVSSFLGYLVVYVAEMMTQSGLT